MSVTAIIYFVLGCIYSGHFAYHIWTDKGLRPSDNITRFVFALFYIFAFLAWPFCLAMDGIESIRKYRSQFKK